MELVTAAGVKPQAREEEGEGAGNEEWGRLPDGCCGVFGMLCMRLVFVLILVISVFVRFLLVRNF